MTSTAQRVLHPDDQKRDLRRQHERMRERKEITRALKAFYDERVERAADDPVDDDIDILTGGTYA